MEIREYKKIVNKYTPKESRFKNATFAFIIGGFMGVIGNFLIDFYSYYFNITSKDSSVLMIISLIFLSCILTCLGFFDKWVAFAKCGLIIPITGFAHSMMSSALEYRKEGFVTGIGMNMLKLAGSVIIYGIVSAYIFGLLRLITLGG